MFINSKHLLTKISSLNTKYCAFETYSSSNTKLQHYPSRTNQRTWLFGAQSVRRLLTSSRPTFTKEEESLKDSLPTFEEPNADGSPDVPQKLIDLAEQFVALTTVESAQVAQLIQHKMGIRDEELFGGGPSVASGASQQEDDGDAEPEAPKKTSFTLKLEGFADGSKFKVLKEIRALNPALSLTECKALIDNMPSVLLENVSPEECSKWKSALEPLGADLAEE
eukprot:CAMPEP_0201561562 /NCGR_PEP_ID=MMETSP0173_2-20130828/78863_1 /ASSEMBLY_ACC=CAM_ASM_000268 /TAXON_ID=218659 /ORGANISM="Vexillifera sp., Strain DIVA3 564/2" /LENGTH=222 /DNA_ID=CAMNT_0047976075 /DNA_START=951 /DNA_END=1619 /DNA_ORIENTATION=+